MVSKKTPVFKLPPQTAGRTPFHRHKQMPFHMGQKPVWLFVNITNLHRSSIWISFLMWSLQSIVRPVTQHHTLQPILYEEPKTTLQIDAKHLTAIDWKPINSFLTKNLFKTEAQQTAHALHLYAVSVMFLTHTHTHTHTLLGFLFYKKISTMSPVHLYT